MTLAYVPPTDPAAIEVASARDEFPDETCPGTKCPDNAQPKLDDRGSGRIQIRRYAAQVWVPGGDIAPDGSLCDDCYELTGITVIAGRGETKLAWLLADLDLPAGHEVGCVYPVAADGFPLMADDEF